MNTGIQKSSLTPFGARTTTTPAGKNLRGNLRDKKNLFEIVAAHGIPYAATASIGYLEDYMRKVEKASKIKGPKYIHVLAPCPTGWGIDVSETVEVAKEVVDCGLWFLAEYENGEFTLTQRPAGFSDPGGVFAPAKPLPPIFKRKILKRSSVPGMQNGRRSKRITKTRRRNKSCKET